MKFLFLFDIDGTILSLKQYRSKHIFYKAFTELFGKCAEPDLMPQFAGMTDLQIIDDLCLLSDLPKEYVYSHIPDIWQRLTEIFVSDINRENVMLMPYITEFLEYLHSRGDIVTSLVTGNFRENAYLKLRLFGLDKYFATGAFGSDEADRNLLPALAIRRSNSITGEQFLPENSVVIGDSPADIKCAKVSGCVAVGVATGRHSVKELSALNPDFIYGDFSDFKDKTEEIINLIIKVSR